MNTPLKLKISRCTNLTSAEKYNFEHESSLFYYDLNERTITKSKYNNPFYLDGDNYPFRAGEWRKIDIGDNEYSTVSVLGLGHSITKATLKNHNVVARIQYFKK